LKTGKHDTTLIPVLNAFKITIFLHLEDKSMMTEYSFYNCIRYRNAKTWQNIRSNKQDVRKDANCVSNAEIKQLFSVANTKTKTQLKLICQIFHFAYKIQ